MKKLIKISLLILSWNYSTAQLSKSSIDTLNDVNESLSTLIGSTRFNNYVKYKFEFSNTTDAVKLFSLTYDSKTNEKVDQYNVASFKLSEIDPNAVVIRAYNSKEIMLQIIAKNNSLSVNSIFIRDGKELGNSMLDRASISSYDSKMYKVQLERLRNSISYVVRVAQTEPNRKYQTDTSNLKTILQKNGDNTTTVDLSKLNKNKGHFVFGVMENSPVFLDSKTTKETEVNARNYLIGKAKEQNYNGKGKVFVEFVIDESGKVKDIQVLKGINSELDDLSVRIIKQMPTWIPGKVNGKNVSTKFSTNIEF